MNNQELKKRSRQGSIISLIGFLVITAAFVFAGNELSNLNQEIDDKSQVVDSLTTLDSLLEKRIAELVDSVNWLTDPTIVPMSKADKIDGVYYYFDDGDKVQLFDFTIWLVSSSYTLDQIDSVTYRTENRTSLERIRESKSRSNGFLISYRGYGFLPMYISIYCKDGSVKEMFYNGQNLEGFY